MADMCRCWEDYISFILLLLQTFLLEINNFQDTFLKLLRTVRYVSLQFDSIELYFNSDEVNFFL